MTTTSDAKAPGGLDVAALLAAPGLTSTLGDRLQAADANGDGVISASEMVDVFQSEATAIRDNKMMKRALIALGVACLLIIAAVVGLTYAVVEMSKDTSVQNNVLVGKDGRQPLSTATLQKRVKLADLYKADRPSELDWMTHVTVPFGEGEAVLKIQNMYLVPGQSVRFDTAAEGVSVEVTADGVTVSGDEQAIGGRRRLMQAVDGTVSGPASGSSQELSRIRIVIRKLTDSVSFSSDEQTELDVSSSDTILSVKEKIYSVGFSGLLPENQRLILYDGTQLDDAKTLAFYNILEDGETIVLASKLDYGSR